MLLGSLSTLNVDEVCVSKATGLASAAIDGNTDVKNVLDFSEKVYGSVSQTLQSIRFTLNIPFKSLSLIW